jgi:hypothetical protein
VIPGLGHLALGRWRGALLVAAYLIWVGLVWSDAVPLWVWFGPALLAEIGAQVSVMRLTGSTVQDLIDG